MSSRPADEQRTTTAFDLLAKPQRRYLLAELLEDAAPSNPAAPSSATDSGSKSIESVVTEVASKAYDRPIVTDEQCERTHVSLVHLHLPRLADAGVVTRSNDGTIEPRSHPILEAEWVRRLLANPGDGNLGDPDRLNRTCDVLRSPRRRTVLRVLARRRGRVPTADLAAQVAKRTSDASRLADVSETECARLETDLCHSHLPALADAGLVEHDPAAEAAAIETDAPHWRTDWLAAGPLGEIAERLDADAGPTTGPRPESAATGDAGVDGGADASSGRTAAPSCWTVEGATDVLGRGRELAASAENELFVMLPDERMIRRRCLDQWRAAADRGVDVYVASQSPRVLETVRAAVPEVTVCEPQFDWLNVPVERVHHGRVVLADRERVMLVTIDEGTVGAPRVAALTGEGPDDVLVSLVCEHVGPRLDRLAARRDEHEPTDGPAALPM